MATIKSYTDLEQSKKLAKILPIESADMWWSRCTITDFGDGVLKVSYAVEPCNISQFRNTKEDIPCWSLAALIAFLKNQDSCISIKITNKDVTAFYYKYNSWKEITIKNENAIDACIELIIELKKNGII